MIGVGNRLDFFKLCYFLLASLQEIPQLHCSFWPEVQAQFVPQVHLPMCLSLSALAICFFCNPQHETSVKQLVKMTSEDTIFCITPFN